MSLSQSLPYLEQRLAHLAQTHAGVDEKGPMTPHEAALLAMMERGANMVTRSLPGSGQSTPRESSEQFATVGAQSAPAGPRDSWELGGHSPRDSDAQTQSAIQSKLQTLLEEIDIN